MSDSWINPPTENELHDVREDLGRYKKARECADAMLERIRVAEDRLKSVGGQNLDGMPHGGVKRDTGDILGDIEELKERANRLESKAERIRARVLGFIDEVDDIRMMTALERFYVDGLTVEKSAEAMGYSTRYTQALLAAGVAQIAVIRRSK